MSELKTLTGKNQNKAFKSLLQKGAVITKNVLPATIKAIVKKYIDIEEITEALENVTKSAVEILKDEIDEYAVKKKGLVDFRKELEDYIKETNTGKPLVFIIDELDRCRPNYAVEVLEQIKHFFNVPGIVFILSIDKEQLGNGVRGFYGSEQINANEYLRRFIDLEYTLPAPDRKAFTKYLYNYFDFNSYFNSDGRKNYAELRYDGMSFIEFATELFEKNNVTLRQQEKLFAHARVGLCAFVWNNYVFPSLFILLIYVKNFHQAIYRKLHERQLPTQEILNLFKVILSNINTSRELNLLVATEADLAYLYNNYYAENNYSSKIIERENGDYKLLITSGFDGQDTQLLACIENNLRIYSGTKITHLLNKIDLIENLTL
ncbi:KAP family P-loop domain protein [compost metagenome]